MADQEPSEPTVINFAGAVNEQIMESIKNMDVLTVLQKMVAQSPEDEESVDIKERLKGVMTKFYEMSPEEQEMFTQQIKQGLVSKITARLRDPDSPLKMTELGDAIRGAVIEQLILVGVIGAIMLFLFVFFGYKLYKSIRDKEKKKEDKKKAKQQKKKK